MGAGRGATWRTLGALAVLLVFSAPLVIMVGGSLRKPGLPPPRTFELLPDPVVFSNYERAVDLAGLGRATVNSLLVATIAAGLSVLVASWAGFALVHVPRRLARALIAASFVALMVPLTALLVPRFAIFRTLGLT